MSSRKKKILHIIPSLETGGAEILLLHTIKLFNEFEHHIICFKVDQQLLEQFESYAVLHIYDNSILSLKSIFHLRRLEKKLDPVIIHAHLLKTNWLSRIVFPFKENLFNTIHSPYSQDAFIHNRRALWMEKLTYWFSSVSLVFVSSYVKEDYEKFIQLRSSHHILNNFVEMDYFRIDGMLYTIGEPLRLIAVGGIKPLKNYKLLIESFKELKHLPISLDIYGGGPLLESFRKEVRDSGIKIDFKGNSNLIQQVIGNYHALIFPSLYEGFSIALLEAMAAGLSLILSDIPMFKLLANGNAIYFNPRDVNDCRTKIINAYKQGFERSQIQANKNFVAENFSEVIYKKKLYDIYQIN